MKIRTTMFFTLFCTVLFLSGSVLAQDSNVEPVRSYKDGLDKQSGTEVSETILKIDKESRQIQYDSQAGASDVLVNDNVGLTGTSRFTQSETSILAFGNNVVIGFNDSGSFGFGSHFTGWSYSTDGGATFTDGGFLPASGIGDAGDPVLARDTTSGRIYFSTLGFSGANTIQVFRSDDNGVTWQAPVNGTPGGSSEDKQWIEVDNYPGSGNGNVYLISRSFGAGNGIKMYRSTDNGATFGPSGGVSIVSGNQGAFVAVGPDHSVYAFWYANTSLQMRKSTDQGVSFGSAVTVATGLSGGVNGDLGLTGLRQGTGSFSSFRSNEFPHAAVNPISGDIYVTFANNPAGVDKADVFMVMSTNGGATWSSSVRVNDDATTTDQWQPTLAVSPDGANIGIFYYSRQEDTGSNNLFKYYGRTGSITGSTVTFGTSFAISDVGSLPEFGRDAVVNSVYMGDYNHAAATNSDFHVVWSDNRDDLPGGGTRKDPNVYYEKIPIGPPCPVTNASNPTPSNSSTDVSISLPQISWANGANATEIEVFFGEAGNMVSVYSGPLVTFLATPIALTYSTTYEWRIESGNGSCTVNGPVWSFTVEDDPNAVVQELYCDDFDGGLGDWTITNDGGTCVWENLGVGANSYTLPPEAMGNLLAADSDICGSGTTLLSTATLNQSIDFTNFTVGAWIEFDNDWRTISSSDEAHVEVSTNGGSTWVSAVSWVGVDQRNTHEVLNITSIAAGQSDVRFRLRTIQPGWDWWWVVDNFCVYGETIIPVELTSFTATTLNGDVQLNWLTATETNNQGFEVERKSSSTEFEKVGYVAGFGTTTEIKSYTFTDSKVTTGDYIYRLKQIDFDGSFGYSPEVEIDVTAPIEYALDQNYPNPFNPSTVIKYSIPDEGFVKLAVYNMLGEEVDVIVNSIQKAGRYEVNFSASKLSSGVYVYRLEASKYTASKKLMLLK